MIGETVAKHPAIKGVGSKLAPAQEAVNFSAKLKFGAAAAARPPRAKIAEVTMDS